MTSRTFSLAVAAVVLALASAAPASAERFIYYGSNNGSGVSRADIDGSNPTNIIGGGQFAASMAVDKDHIYFKSLTTAISRADIDGSNLNSNFVTLPSNATAIKEIEVNATHVFWTDDTNNSIGRARIAGPCTVGSAPPCDIEPNWIEAGAAGTGNGGVSGLAINSTHAYWTRAVAGAIARADLDGTHRDTSFITAINNPILDQAPFDVDVNGTHIYWTDAPDKLIGRAKLNGSGPPSNLERAYVSTDLNSITAVEANGTHVFWASDGGTIGRARTAGTCNVALAPPCDVEPSFIGGGNQLRSLELGVAPVDVVVTDCDAPELAALTEITGDLIVQNVPGCDAISFPNLSEIGGIVVIKDNTEADVIDIGSLVETSGSISIEGNTSATVIDIGSLVDTTGAVSIKRNTDADAIDIGALVSVIGSIDVNENASDTVVDIGALSDVTGHLTLETTGATVDLSRANVEGDLSLTGNGSDRVKATTAGGTTDVEVLGGTAAMRVVLPDGAFDRPVAFTIERQGNGAPETGTTSTGAAAVVDPVAGYRFAFDVTTLALNAQLAFTVDLAQLDATTRAALLAGITDQTATLVLRADGSGATYQALGRCTGGQTPAADRCVTAVLLGADGQPAGPVAAPAFARFESTADPFSAFAVARLTPVPSTVPTSSPTPGTSPLTPRPAASPKPSNAFRLTGLKRDRRTGTATVTAKLSGPGSLVVKGKGLSGLRRTVTSKTVKIPIRVTGAAKRELQRTGRVRVRLTVVYTPVGGDPNTRTMRIMLTRTKK